MMSRFVTLCYSTQIRLNGGNDVIRLTKNFAPEEFFGEAKLVSTMDTLIDSQGLSSYMGTRLRTAFCQTQKETSTTLRFRKSV